MSNFFILMLSEFILFWTLVDRYSFGQVLLWYWAPSVLALGLLSIFGRFLLMRAQVGMQSGFGVDRASIHPMAVLLGLVLLLPPLVLTRILGLGLILPGIRHLLLWKFRDLMITKMRNAFQNPQGSGFRFYTRGFGMGDSHSPGEAFNHEFRDVTPKSISAADEIIDVTATSRKSTEKNDGNHH